MNLKQRPLLDFGFRVIAVFLLLFISIEVDKFSFGMMKVTNPIPFGLGVALFCGSNLIFGYIIVDIIKSIYKES